MDFVGLPEAPIVCYVLNVTANEVQLLCIPGFDGGEQVSVLFKIFWLGQWLYVKGNKFKDSFLRSYFCSLTSSLHVKNHFYNRASNLQPSFVVEQSGLRVYPGETKSQFQKLSNGSYSILVEQMYPNITYTLKVYWILFQRILQSKELWVMITICCSFSTCSHLDG